MKRFFRNYFLLFMLCSFAVVFIVLYSSLTHQAVKDINRRFAMELHQIQFRLDDELPKLAARNEEQKAVLLGKARMLATEISHNPEKVLDHDWILEMGKNLDVSSICVSDENGVLIAATDEGFIGFHMDSTAQSAEFMPACKDKDFEYAQDPGQRGIDKLISQYVGVGRIDRRGIVQVCKEYTEGFVTKMDVLRKIMLEHNLEHDLILTVPETSSWSADTPIMASSTPAVNGKAMGYAGFSPTSLSKVVKINGKYCYAQHCGVIRLENEEYPLFANIGVESMFSTRNRTLLVSSFLFLILAAVIYCAIMNTMQKNIVGPIYRINSIMEQVIAGDLHINIEEKHLPEFAALSDSINTTVAELLRRNRLFKKQVSGERDISRSVLNTINDLNAPFFPNINTIDFSAYFEQSEALGADYVEILKTADGSPAFVIADSSGAGVAACLYMMKFRASLHKCAEAGVFPPLPELLRKLRAELAAEQDNSNLFLSAFFGHYVQESSTLEYVNAGYLPPMIKHAADNTVSRLRAEKVKAVLSAKTNVADELLSVHMEPGDFFLAFSDGMVDCVNDNNEFFTVARLEAALNALGPDTGADAAIRTFNDARKQFCGAKAPEDDIAMIAMRILPGQQKA